MLRLSFLVGYLFQIVHSHSNRHKTQDVSHMKKSHKDQAMKDHVNNGSGEEDVNEDEDVPMELDDDDSSSKKKDKRKFLEKDAATPTKKRKLADHVPPTTRQDVVVCHVSPSPNRAILPTDRFEEEKKEETPQFEPQPQVQPERKNVPAQKSDEAESNLPLKGQPAEKAPLHDQEVDTTTISTTPTSGDYETIKTYPHTADQWQALWSTSTASRLLVGVLVFSTIMLATASFLPYPLHQRRLVDLYTPTRTMKESIRRATGGERDRLFPHIIPPDRDGARLSDITLWDFLVDYRGVHLAMAPAFFGFYGYFGALQAWEQQAFDTDRSDDAGLHNYIRSVAGGSAGAMAAVLLAAGISPSDAADFCTTVTLDKFADPPGIGAVFKGQLFEDLMREFMESQAPDSSLRLEDGVIPVAVSGFDLRTWSGQILSRGNMPRAARASACFPFLFQPVRWVDDDDGRTSFLIDGGVTDELGINGLAAFGNDEPMRVVNIVVGNFLEDGPRGPSNMPEGVQAEEVLSISIRNTPGCGPWAMENGPKATEAARRAMLASLDVPLYEGKEEGHYELHIDATDFIPSSKE